MASSSSSPPPLAPGSSPPSRSASPPPPSRSSSSKLRSPAASSIAPHLSRQSSASQLQLAPAVATALQHKQQHTQQALHILDEMSHAVPDPFVQTVLQELGSVFATAIYDRQPLPQPSSYGSPHKWSVTTGSNSLGGLLAATGNKSTSCSSGASGLIQVGKEYFSLIQVLQNQLAHMEQYQLQIDTKLSLETAIHQELTSTLDALREDLRQVRQKHLVHHELLQTERAQVEELEQDFEALTLQEDDKKKECEHLQLQLDKLHQMHQDLEAKSTYLDFASKLPLKKHLEDKKLREQEEALKAHEEQQHTTNCQLEHDNEFLELKYATLEEQVVKDQTRVNELVDEIQVFEAQKQALVERISIMKPCYTPRPDWEAIIKQTPELSSQKFGWELIETRRHANEMDDTFSGTTGLNKSEEDEEDRDESSLTHRAAILAMGGGGSGGGTQEDCEPGSKSTKSKRKKSKFRGGKRKSQVGLLSQLAMPEDTVMENGSSQQEPASLQPPWVMSPGRIPHVAKRGKTTRLIKDMLHWIENLQKHCGVDLNLSNIWRDVEEARLELSMLHQQLDRAVRKLNRNQQVSTPVKHREYLIALGNGEDVPKFLRHHGKIRMRHLKKPEVEVIVRRVWLEKKRMRERSGLHLSVEEALYERLHQQYGFQPLIAEWGYNILLALNSYVWDSEIEMFLLCLTGAISDEVHDDQEEMVVCCHNLLLTLCESYGDPTFVDEKKVVLKDAMLTLRKFFPLKTSAQLQAIEKAILRDMHKHFRSGTDAMLQLDAILPYTKGEFGTFVYSRGFFVKTIRTQHFREIQDYYQALITELEEIDLVHNGKLTLALIKEVMLEIDPLADPSTVLNSMTHALGLRSRSQVNLAQEVEYYSFVRTMNKRLLKFRLNYDPKAEIAHQKDSLQKKTAATAASTSAAAATGASTSSTSPSLTPSAASGGPIPRLNVTNRANMQTGATVNTTITSARPTDTLPMSLIAVAKRNNPAAISPRKNYDMEPGA